MKANTLSRPSGATSSARGTRSFHVSFRSRSLRSPRLTPFALTVLAAAILLPAQSALVAQTPAESVRQLVAYGAAMQPSMDQAGGASAAMPFPDSDLAAPWAADGLSAPVSGIVGKSASTGAADDESDDSKGRKGTYLIAGSAVVGSALLFNFVSGGGDAFPADNGLVEDNDFLSRTLRPVGPPTTTDTPPQFGEVPFSDTHPTLPGTGPGLCSDPLAASDCLDPLLLGNQEDPADVVPEPMSMTMVATGLVGMALARRRRKN